MTLPVTVGSPVFVARLRVTNALGLFDSLDPVPFAEQARIKFTVTKSLESEPNTATIEVYNLSPIMANLIRGVVRRRIEFSPLEKAALLLAGASAAPVEITSDGFGIAAVELSWGFADSSTMILPAALKIGFKGQSSNIELVTEGNDRVLRIEAEDAGHLLGAGEVIQIAGGGVVPLQGKSYTAGTNVIQIMVDLINAMGLTVNVGILTSAVGQALLARGVPPSDLVLLGPYNASGSAQAQLSQFLEAIGIRWSIQDGQFIVLTGAGVLPGYPPMVLSTALGNILGEPNLREGTKLDIATWPDADARPGRAVNVASSTITAAYRIAKATSTGDTYSGGEAQLELDELVTIAGVF